MLKLTHRRSFTAMVFTLVASWLIFFAAAMHAEAEILIEDAAGRSVRLQSPAKRIVLNESLLLLSLALIDRDPVARIAGWASPQRIDQGIYDAFRQKFPSIDQVPTVGALQPGQASAETIIGVKPDLFVVNQWQVGWEDTTRLLEAAGIPVIFLDGPRNDERNVVEATTFSIDLLGKAIGRDAQAAEYTQFVRDHYGVITRSLEDINRPTTVLVDGFANSTCCSTPGRNNRMTQNIALAGGVSIGAEAVPGYEGKLNPEYVLKANPKVYIATGTPKATSETALIVGGGISEDLARASLRKVVSETVRRDLTAVHDKRAYGISHQASISALNILIVECFAKWLHPERFSHIDPNQTLAEINQRFLAVPLNGTFWIDLGQ
ncbi:ABC transporter substrate-binding protein [Brucella sp. NBRC 12950]|uniref:ABC transporter substrate-binding protein n=1 Tax=Brucella sp. NBRC 12950 TaxID=2994518 RepID=UPI0024A539D6|nr:ABC transporter substrate-binding protein [Brucella sp. NBRC 12950]GLU29952.1 ferrichrome ABC transporter substrate-binding protein [Brucella sp. NBRC 12950]